MCIRDSERAAARSFWAWSAPRVTGVRWGPCHAWRDFKPILGRELSKFSFGRECCSFCVREAFFTLSATTKTWEHTDPLRRVIHSRTTCTTKIQNFTQSVVCRACALCAVCHAWRVFKPLFLIGSIQTFFCSRESSVLCGRGLLQLEHHEDMPGTTRHTYTRY